jgi:hypothetical protein
MAGDGMGARRYRENVDRAFSGAETIPDVIAVGMRAAWALTQPVTRR